MSRRKMEFGPNQDAVDRLLERLESVTHNQAMLLASMAGSDPARRAARQAMLNAARSGGREKQLKRAQDEIRGWVNGWFTGGFQIAGYGRDVTPAEAAVNAMPVVLDAVGAILLEDLLDEEAYETLIGPWLEFVGAEEPANPTA